MRRRPWLRLGPTFESALDDGTPSWPGSARSPLEDSVDVRLGRAGRRCPSPARERQRRSAAGGGSTSQKASSSSSSESTASRWPLRPEDEAMSAAGGQLGLVGLDLAEHQELHGLVAKLGAQLGLGLERDGLSDQLQALTAAVGSARDARPARPSAAVFPSCRRVFCDWLPWPDARLLGSRRWRRSRWSRSATTRT